MISMSLASASAASGSTPWKMPLRASVSSIAHPLVRPLDVYYLKVSLGTRCSQPGDHPDNHPTHELRALLRTVRCGAGTISVVDLTIVDRFDDGVAIPVLVWRLAVPELAICSGPLGGGIGLRGWALNANGPMDYGRADPDVPLARIAADLGLRGDGIGLMTGADVRDHRGIREYGVDAVVTVGLGAPAWAAAPDGDLRRNAVGTINAR